MNSFFKLTKLKLRTSTTFFLGMTLANSAFACASCGCSLSSDWTSQGFSTGSGLRFDLRYDYLNQNQVRSGSGKISTWPVSGHEQELYTKNHYVTTMIDYSSDPNWGFSAQLPYIYRTHATNGMNYDGSDAGTSKTSAIGDIKVLARYQGFSEERNVGVQLGLKLPTGEYKQNFTGGVIAGDTLDRGLQAGTGTTDLLVGAFRFSSLSQNVDYFYQAIAQVPLNSKDDYKPGSSLNINLGFRYLESEKFTPQIQVNARVANKDSGANATPDDSGGKTMYLSPGATFHINKKLNLYTFLQLPVYQNLNGYQLAPKYTVSIGTSFQF
jgi:hypothetical protein